MSACGKGNCEKNAISQAVSLTQVFNKRHLLSAPFRALRTLTAQGTREGPPQSTAADTQCLAHHRLGVLEKCRNIKTCQGRVYWAGFNSYLSFFSPYLQLHQISNSQLCFSSGWVHFHTSSPHAKGYVCCIVSNTDCPNQTFTTVSFTSSSISPIHLWSFPTQLLITTFWKPKLS